MSDEKLIEGRISIGPRDKGYVTVYNPDGSKTVYLVSELPQQFFYRGLGDKVYLIVDDIGEPERESRGWITPCRAVCGDLYDGETRTFDFERRS
jgi:hypothetical protein